MLLQLFSDIKFLPYYISLKNIYQVKNKIKNYNNINEKKWKKKVYTPSTFNQTKRKYSKLNGIFKKNYLEAGNYSGIFINIYPL